MKIRQNSFWQPPVAADMEKRAAAFRKGAADFPPAFPDHSATDDDVRKASDWAKRMHDSGVEKLIVIGMGGSSLGMRAVEEFCGGSAENRRLVFLEGTHETRMRQAIQGGLDKAAAVFVSKSGTTLESRANLAWLRQNRADLPVAAATSEPEKIADLGIAPENVFLFPKPLGGRFSIHSHVGLLPGFFAGFDMNAFHRGFHAGVKKYAAAVPEEKNAAKSLAAAYHAMFSGKYNGVIFWIYRSDLRLWGDWLAQLWGESIGKHTGVTALPYLCRGPEDQHSLLQFFLGGPDTYLHHFLSAEAGGGIRFESDSGVFIRGKSADEILDAQKESIMLAATEKKLPVADLLLPSLKKNGSPDLELFGAFMAFWMHTVSYLGFLYGVNPFDQPAVEAGKKYCFQLLKGEPVPQVFSEYREL